MRASIRSLFVVTMLGISIASTALLADTPDSHPGKQENSIFFEKIAKVETDLVYGREMLQDRIAEEASAAAFSAFNNAQRQKTAQSKIRYLLIAAEFFVTAARHTHANRLLNRGIPSSWKQTRKMSMLMAARCTDDVNALLASHRPKPWELSYAHYYLAEVSGRIALLHGDKLAASRFLVESGKYAVHEVEPDMSLCGLLLQAGRKSAVTAFLKECSKTWAPTHTWLETIEHGKTPDFSSEYVFDAP